MAPWWWLVVFFVGVAGVLAALAVQAVRRFRVVRGGAGLAGLHTTGRPAEAEIVWVAYRQEAFRGDPVVAVTVRLAPLDGSAPVTGTRDLFVSALTAPWFGEPMAARYDPADPDRFVLTARIAAGPPRPAPHPCDAVNAIARLGRLDEDLAAGRLTREAHFAQANELYNANFP